VVEVLDGAVRIEVGQALRRRFGPGVVVDLARQWWGVL
jgi:hypothetical protein